MPENNILPAAPNGILSRVEANGSMASKHLAALRADFSAFSGADLADIAHFLCILHGRHPGVVDHAATKTADPNAREWLVQAMDGFAAERAFLTRLTVAAGPISGIGSDDQSNATVMGQRKAMDMLAQSDRDGCALGASFALILDWHDLRPILDQIALKIGIEPRTASLPGIESTEALNQLLSQTASVARAINFGVDQILTQHSGLWQLLSARRKARDAA